MERSVATTVHGRYLVRPAATELAAPLLVGFHGYAEGADAQMERLRAIPESVNWICVSIQALHRFYERRTGRVVASWMTRQDRELAIDDNLAYFSNCVDAVSAEWPVTPRIVLAGFSQGVAMAFRAAVQTRFVAAGVIAVGGDIPPEIGPEALKNVEAALLARGADDGLYTKEKFADDEQRLRESGVGVRALEFHGGHEWPSAVVGAASQFLQERW